ncbi:MAG: 50S ribosomal protein L4 [Desulfobacteraceae bacterium]|nr:50S ribosomal protein L4 [Desulfobacteraceae bacterium]
MAAVEVIDRAGQKVSKIDLSDGIFGMPVKKSVLHDVVRMQLAKRRSGTAKVKGRSEIVGSTKKLYRQKGTGNARSGDVKSPLRRGGGVIFGPTQRSYSHKIPKKVRLKALKMALSSKLEAGELFIIDDLKLDQVKTKEFARILSDLNLKKTLIIYDNDDQNVFLSARNIPDVKLIKTAGLNVYDILRYDNLLLVESAVKGIEGRLL